jgi:hypothetical protein
MIPLDNYAKLMGHIDRKESDQAEWLGHFLYDILQPKSVIDWGCASGLYLKPFSGCKVCGIDGEPTGGSNLKSDEFFCLDIRKHLVTDHYDLALCIEVAEHIQLEYADTLVDNLVYSSDVIFWSAAQPGQGGQFHYNEQPINYWSRKFAERGYVIHPLNSLIITEIANSNKTVKWLRRNTRLWWKYAD